MENDSFESFNLDDYTINSDVCMNDYNIISRNGFFFFYYYFFK